MTRLVCKSFVTVAIVLAAVFISGCDSIIPESWNDPTYFGNSENFGKDSKTSGMGYETYKFDF